jgi:hypothetical protein
MRTREEPATQGKHQQGKRKKGDHPSEKDEREEN